MKISKFLMPVAALLLVSGQALAQSEDEARLQELEAREAEYALQMKQAEERLAEAAQRVAELSTRRLESMGDRGRYEFDFSDKPRLGVNIENDGKLEPVEGVRIVSVTPGSPADDAGIRAGDLITAVNDEVMSAESTVKANMLLLDFMKGVEEGDVLKVEYLRDGKVGSVELEPRVVRAEAFVWSNRRVAPMAPIAPVPEIHVSPGQVERFRFSFGGWRGGWANMEVVELTEDLGRYFGTDEGLLVISAPEGNAFKLQDGDVIQGIDGREPTSVNHCMRILGSYQPGEKITLNIMRNKRREKIEIEIPDDRTSLVFPDAPVPARPAAVPAPERAPAPKVQDQT